MVLVVYKGSYISVSDRFLFKKQFYFDICIGFIAIVAHASDFFLWNFQTVGLYIYALEGLECQG